MPEEKRNGLVLTGGGARSAYQVGALRAVLEMSSACRIDRPFPIITGTSAGALNAAFLAANAHRMKVACRQLNQVWSHLSTDQIYRSDMLSILKNGLSALLEITTGGLIKKKNTQALLDTTPIQRLIEQQFSPEDVAARFSDGSLHSLALKALNYSSGESTTFYQSREYVDPWIRVRRQAEETVITAEHILASASIPVIFPPVKIGSDYFGDGSLRNLTPMSPAIKLGAQKLLIIGVRQTYQPEISSHLKPSLARIIGIILNSVLLDAVDLDYERMSRINDTVSKLEDAAETSLKHVDVLMLRPSIDLRHIAYEEAPKLPRTIRYLLKGLGNRNESADLISYLMFEPSYIKRLIRLGYEDTLCRKDELRAFFS